jgi:hypothetical protein
MPVYDWSQTANTNASADPTVNYEIGMAPSEAERRRGGRHARSRDRDREWPDRVRVGHGGARGDRGRPPRHALSAVAAAELSACARDLCGWRRSAITIKACGNNFEKPLWASPLSVVYRMG